MEGDEFTPVSSRRHKLAERKPWLDRHPSVGNFLIIGTSMFAGALFGWYLAWHVALSTVKQELTATSFDWDTFAPTDGGTQ